MHPPAAGEGVQIPEGPGIRAVVVEHDDLEPGVARPVLDAAHAGVEQFVPVSRRDQDGHERRATQTVAGDGDPGAHVFDPALVSAPPQGLLDRPPLQPLPLGVAEPLAAVRAGSGSGRHPSMVQGLGDMADLLRPLGDAEQEVLACAPFERRVAAVDLLEDAPPEDDEVSHVIGAKQEVRARARLERRREPAAVRVDEALVGVEEVEVGGFIQAGHHLVQGVGSELAGRLEQAEELTRDEGERTSDAIRGGSVAGVHDADAAVRLRVPVQGRCQPRLDRALLDQT